LALTGADHAGSAAGADDDHRDPEMFEDRSELGPAHRLVEVLRVDEPADRGPEPDIGGIHEDQRQQEMRHAKPISPRKVRP
jgi:hypothetical protein